MILTCPECATSYFVDDSRIPPSGRRVRCSSCGHRWTAGPDGPIAEQPPAPVAPEIAAAPPVEPVAFEPLPDPAIEPAPPEPPPAPIRRPAPRSSSAPVESSRSRALVWASAAGLAAALIAGVIVFREQIVRVWPRSSAAYAGLGLPVDAGGLVLEHVRAEPAFLAGRPVLSVTGAIHNVRDAPVNAPPVRFTLLNRAGQPIEAKIARPIDANIPARAVRHFAVTMLDPPANARDLEVRFETSGGGKATQAAVLSPAVPPPPAAPLPAAAPVSAAPALSLSPAAQSEHG
jgi:predicted Zn finger-like uncharacterized protein